MADDGAVVEVELRTASEAFTAKKLPLIESTVLDDRSMTMDAFTPGLDESRVSVSCIAVADGSFEVVNVAADIVEASQANFNSTVLERIRDWTAFIPS